MKGVEITVLESIQEVIRMKCSFNGGVSFIFCGAGLRQLGTSL